MSKIRFSMLIIVLALSLAIVGVSLAADNLLVGPDITLDPLALSAVTGQGETVTQTLVIGNVGDANLTWELYDGVPSTGWSDNFDTYPTDTSLHGLGGWKGWGNSPSATAYTRDTVALSAPNSVEIMGASDLVHEYSAMTSGDWVYTAMQYIPTDFTGDTYFILLNQYDDAGFTNNWSTEVLFSSATDLVSNDGPAGGTLPIIYGQWVEIRVEIDLDNDIQSFYYGGDLLFTGSWTEGMSGGGILNIAAVDLFANSSSAVYYDDLSLLSGTNPECGVIGDVPWLSTEPITGTTAPGTTSDVTVFFDATGLDLGTYTADLCAASNDPDDPLIPIPVTFTVAETADLSIEKTASADEVMLGDTITYTLVVSNLGPNTAFTTTVEDTLPAMVGFVSASEGCTHELGVVICDLGDLASGDTVTQTVTVTATVAGLATNVAEVESVTIDPDLANNTATVDTTIIGEVLYEIYLPLVMRQP